MVETVPTPSDNAIENAKTYIADWVSDQRIPGASLAIVDDDEVHTAAFGAKNLEQNIPTTADTLYGIGSCTKSFTAVAIMQLAEAGDLCVTDAVTDYVSYYENVPGEPVTIRELLTHSSKMPSDGMATALISRMMGADPIEVPLSSREDFCRHVQDSADERATHLEDPFFYYNSGYTVLGEIVAKVSGQAYADYIREHILTPLQMERSTFRRERFETDDDTMTPYFKKDNSSVEGNFPFDDSIYAPGGLLSSVSELVNYLRMYMNEGEFNETRILSTDSIEEMWTPISRREQLLDGTDQNYGYGWMLRDFLNDTLIGHGGGIGVYNAFVGHLQNAGIGVALLCTTTPATHPMHAGPGVLAHIQDEPPTVAVPHLALKERLPALTGTYESYRGIMSLNIERIGGGLKLTADSGQLASFELVLVPEHIGSDSWRFRTVDASGADLTVKFELTDDGTDMYYQRWRLHQSDT